MELFFVLDVIKFHNFIKLQNSYRDWTDKTVRCRMFPRKCRGNPPSLSGKRHRRIKGIGKKALSHMYSLQCKGNPQCLEKHLETTRVMGVL